MHPEVYNPLVEKLKEIFAEVELGQGCMLLGTPRKTEKQYSALGSSSPARFSAVELTLKHNDQAARIWLPCPINQGPAFFLHSAGHRLVMPVIRLCLYEETRPGSNEKKLVGVEYLDLSNWLLDALCRWRVQRQPEDATLYQFLKHLASSRAGATVAEAAKVLAAAIRHALFGRGIRFHYQKSKQENDSWQLWLSPRSPWTRWLDHDQELYCRCAQRMVLTAGAVVHDGGLISVPSTFGKRERIQPTSDADYGIDPVHTPEGDDIRLRGYLGTNVTIKDRKLQVASSSSHGNLAAVPLSPSTVQVPFAQHNDPRRLLIAANQQMQAVPVQGCQSPRVRVPCDAPAPPGVNLRVGYLAWQGLNHEDAWVLSESAAKKLATRRIRRVTIPIEAYELPVEVLVRCGDSVKQGHPLVKRRFIPVLLTGEISRLAKLFELQENNPLEESRADPASTQPAFRRIEEWFKAFPLPTHDKDRAPCSGLVKCVKVWDLLKKEHPSDIDEVADGLPCRFRQIVCIEIEETLPLRVGDKLANRHGHKGIVGAILPDEQMPVYQGQPLEALIDPISVLNRSNWGQIYETVVGRLSPGPITVGHSATAEQRQKVQQNAQVEVQPAEAASWIENPVRAVVGTQFVFRLPHHAVEKLGLSPDPAPGFRRRTQRFGDMDMWALWAHAETENGLSPADQKGWQKALGQLRSLLLAAGISLSAKDEKIVVQSVDLTKPPDKSVRIISCPDKGSQPNDNSGADTPSLTEKQDEKKNKEQNRKKNEKKKKVLGELEKLPPDQGAVLELPSTVEGVRLPFGSKQKKGNTESEDAQAYETSVRYLYVPPEKDRPNRVRADGSEQPHPLWVALQGILRRLDEWQSGTLERYSLTRYLRTAYECALGKRDGKNNKNFVLNRRVLGRRMKRSARAVIAPAGPYKLNVDEVGIPLSIAAALLGKRYGSLEELKADKDEIKKRLSKRRFWIKRDPVLHRWGLVWVKARLIDGHDDDAVIRLPASLLGPMGADFDGDQAAMFARAPLKLHNPRNASPVHIFYDDIRKEIKYLPGKQYLYGIRLLTQNESLWKQCCVELGESGSTFPDAKLLRVNAKKALADWLRKTGSQSKYCWRIIEEFALAALRVDPGMGLGLLRASELAQLEVVKCGAAKNLFSTSDADSNEQVDPWFLAVERGESLARYQQTPLSSGEPPDAAKLDDPIAKVMVTAKEYVGNFGGALRRLIYAMEKVTPESVRVSQAITEFATQQSLSVKSGQEPLAWSDYHRVIRQLIARQRPAVPASLAEIEGLIETLYELLEKQPEARHWRWLRDGQLYKELLRSENHLIQLDGKDLRLLGWLNALPENTQG